MAEEENVFVGTNCQSFDPSKVQCDKEGNMPIHILDKYCEENDTRYNIFPLTVIQAIFDGLTGTRLDRILAACNSVYLTWEGTFADTVNKLDKIYRRKGYIITYRDETNVNWTQRYNSDDISDEAWTNPDNWEGWSFDTVIKDLSEALEEIFTNIGDYKDFLNVLQILRQRFPQTPVSITTNGHRLTRALIAQLSRLMPVYINLSINSSSVTCHRQLMRDSEEKANCAIAAIALLDEYRIPFSCSMVGMPNITGTDDMRQTIRLLFGLITEQLILRYFFARAS